MPIQRHQLLFADGQREIVHLSGKALNRGADGAIYRTKCGRFALKIFHEPARIQQRRHKLWQMMQHAPEDSSVPHFAWPQALLLDQQDRLLGFAMPLLDIGSHVSLDPVLTRRGRELEQLPQGCDWRLQVAINLSRRVAELHERGHCIIDLKPANLLVHRNTGDVSIVDCDGFAVQGNGEYFPAHQFTAGYIAPEAWRASLKPEALRQGQDEFALAVILFGLLNNGLHPFQGIPAGGSSLPSDNQGRIAGGFYPYGIQPHSFIRPSPWSVHHSLPRIIREAFDSSLTALPRVSAWDWVNLLLQAAPRMQYCAHNAEHGYWSTQCPYCNLLPQPNSPPPGSRTEQRPPTRSTTPSRGSNRTAALISLGILIVLLWDILADLVRSVMHVIWLAVEMLLQLQAPTLPATLPPAATPAPAAVYSQLERGFNAGPALSPTRSLQGRDIALWGYDGGSALLPWLSSLQNDGALLLLSAPSSYDKPRSLRRPPELLQPDAQWQQLSKLDRPYLEPDNRGSPPYGTQWKQDPRPHMPGIYMPLCKHRLCRGLARLGPTQTDVIELPEWQGKLQDIRVSPWLYDTSPDGNFVVIASARQLIIRTDPGQPTVWNSKTGRFEDPPSMLLELPARYHGMMPTSLSVAQDARSLVLGMSAGSGSEHQAVLLQVRRDDQQLLLDTRFNEEHDWGGRHHSGAWAQLSEDGQTLATSDWSEVSAGHGSPGISIWQREGDGPWQLTRHLSASELGTTSIQPLTGPQLRQWQESASTIMLGNSLAHYGFQLSHDGQLLLTGLQIKTHLAEHEASTRLFLLRGSDSYCLGWLRSTFIREPFLGVIEADLQMSANGHHAVLGWFHLFRTGNAQGYRQNYQIEHFQLPRTNDRTGCPALVEARH